MNGLTSGAHPTPFPTFPKVGTGPITGGTGRGLLMPRLLSALAPHPPLRRCALHASNGGSDVLWAFCPINRPGRGILEGRCGFAYHLGALAGPRGVGLVRDGV